jgi:putative membrane protein
MTTPPPSRKPRVFDTEDPAVMTAPAEPEPKADAVPPPGVPPVTMPSKADISRGFAWGTMFLSAIVSLAGLAASVWFARFVSVLFARDDWVGWTATGLLIAGATAGIVILGREIVGLWRLGRLAGLRAEADRALAARDVKAENAVAGRLTALFAQRPDLAWSMARFREHQRDVHDAGELLTLADRDILAPLDTQARRLILTSAKRVATVTALSPMALIAVGFVAFENLAMMRKLATLYGGRPGFFGGLRLARLVVGHLIATGGIALTDDLLGQFVGQDVLRRLSTRLGEGAFNGALTARLGTAAVEVTRPLPFIEATPIRARDFIAELFRKAPTAPEATRPEARK